MKKIMALLVAGCLLCMFGGCESQYEKDKKAAQEKGKYLMSDWGKKSEPRQPSKIQDIGK